MGGQNGRKASQENDGVMASRLLGRPLIPHSAASGCEIRMNATPAQLCAASRAGQTRPHRHLASTWSHVRASPSLGHAAPCHAPPPCFQFSHSPAEKLSPFCTPSDRTRGHCCVPDPIVHSLRVGEKKTLLQSLSLSVSHSSVLSAEFRAVRC